VVAQTRERIKDSLKSDGIAGVSALLIDGRNVVWSQGFGSADRKAGTRVTRDTVFRTGSLSQVVTILAALRLSDEGRLDLSAPVPRILPEFSIPSRFHGAQPITVRDLMTHQAGLPVEHLAGSRSRSPASWRDITKILSRDEAVSPPGTRTQESHLGMTLLGLIVEKAAGMPFEQFARQEILAPLGMGDSGFSNGTSPLADAARGHRKKERQPNEGIRDVPALGLDSTAPDIAKLLQFVMTGESLSGARILDPATRESITRPWNTGIASDLGFPWGLGFHLAGFGYLAIQGGGPVIVQSGGSDLFPAVMAALPEHGLGVVVLANSAEAHRSVGQIAGKLLAGALEAKTGIVQPQPPEFSYAEPMWPRQRLETFAGHWATLLGLIRVEARDGYLRVKVFGRTFRLVPRTDGLLHLEYRLLGVIRINLKELEVFGLSIETVAGRDILALHQGRVRIPFGIRVRPADLPQAWTARLGRYRIGNAGDDDPMFTDIRLENRDGLLVADLGIRGMDKFTYTLVLTPDGKDRAIIEGTGPGSGAVLEARPEGNGEALWTSGYRFQRTAR
jgi:CubicO group peptidase (beta-lactamase class C family)